MNEQKKSFQNYTNPKLTKNEQLSMSLVNDIKVLLSCSSKISLTDLIYLKNMLKQLNQHKNIMSNKVLRSIEKKLQTMQQQYQR